MTDPAFGNFMDLIYADIATFAKAPLAEYCGLEGADVAVVGIPWDETAMHRPGARFGPRAIRLHSGHFYTTWHPDPSPFTGYGPPRRRVRDRIHLVDCGDVRMWPGDVLKTSASIRSAVGQMARQAFPIMLGGDHYVMYPSYQGVCDAHPGQKIGIIHIDAHPDLVDSDPVLGTHWNGTPIWRSIEHGQLSSQAVLQIGLRGFIHRAEQDIALQHGIRCIGIPEFRRLGPDEAARLAIETVKPHCDGIYLTMDIDSCDPSCAPGCSTPVPGGLLSDEFIGLARALGRCKEIIALDLVELAPNLDPAGITPILAVHALFSFIEERFLLSPLNEDADGI